jgi:hypothetical protein
MRPKARVSFPVAVRLTASTRLSSAPLSGFLKKVNFFIFYYDGHFIVNRLYYYLEGYMPFTAGEKIKVILGRRGMTLADLAEKTGQSRPNMSNKIELFKNFSF